jgi:iron(III) transport system ATP-binding protein
MAISDRIIVMRDGNIEQSGKPLDIYDTPRTRFVADFIGAANVIAGAAAGASAAGNPLVKVGDATIECAPGSKLLAPNADGLHLVAVRTVYPQMRRGGSPQTNQWPGKVVRRVLLGDIVNYTVRWAGGELRVHGFPSELFGEGEDVQIHIPAERAIPVMAD